MAEYVSREQFFKLGGLDNVEGAYTPVSIGKGAKIRDGSRSWAQSVRNLDFTDVNGLRALKPEIVTEEEVKVLDVVRGDYKAIVGADSKKVYSIRSKVYHPVQHATVIDVLADVADTTGLKFFGTSRVEGSRMNTMAYFSDQLPEQSAGHVWNKDPHIFGVRVFNSHNGTTGFGAEFIGVRALCSNMLACGKTLGMVSWKHFTSVPDVANTLTKIVEQGINNIPALADAMERARNEVLTLDEAECLLWGIKLSPFSVESIATHFDGLVPEIKHANGKVSLYDTFNAVTAYNTHSNTGGSEFGRVAVMDKAEDILTLRHIDNVIAQGRELKAEYIEKQRMNANNTAIVSEC